MVLKPAPMRRILVAGLREDKDRVLSLLHDMGVVQIEPLSPPNAEVFAPDRPGEEARALADELLRFRSLVAALPPVPVGTPARFSSVAEVLAAARSIPIDEEVRELKREEDSLLTRRRSTEDALRLVRDHDFFPDDLSVLQTRSALSYFGEGLPEDVERFRAEVTRLSPDVYFLARNFPREIRFILSVPRTSAEEFGRLAQQHAVRLAAVPPQLSGTPPEAVRSLTKEIQGLDQRVDALRARLLEISREWYPRILPIEEELTVEARKAEVMGRLGGIRSSFALEGWVPADDLPRLERELERVGGGRTTLSVIPTHDPGPTLLRNPRPLRVFEFFIRFYSLPQSNEIDPTFIYALVFPVFFGLMLGDVGYGTFILAVCLWIIWRVDNPRAGPTLVPRALIRFTTMIMPPRAMKNLAKALVPGCLIAIGLGVAFDEYFGFTLAQITHGAVNFQLFDPIRGLGTLLVVSGYVGLGMVTLGLAFGALNEWYVHRSRKGVAGKISWVVLAWGIAFAGLGVLHGGIGPGIFPYVGLALAGIVGIVLTEGAQAAIELPSIVSHILSFTRLVGILMASVILALVIDTIFGQLIYGGAIFAVAGIAILLVGQTFNIVLGVFEPGIQGARLLYVEYFSKFYRGSGRPFQPFGAPRRFTLPTTQVPGTPPTPSAAGPRTP